MEVKCGIHSLIIEISFKQDLDTRFALSFQFIYFSNFIALFISSAFSFSKLDWCYVWKFEGRGGCARGGGGGEKIVTPSLYLDVLKIK